MNVEDMRLTINAAGQGHLLKFWSKLDTHQQNLLLQDITKTDFQKINEYFTRCCKDLNSEVIKMDHLMKPLPEELNGSIATTDKATLQSYEDKGLNAIAEGKVGVILLAGGQGTRLGVKYPKGMYNVGLPSQKSLYQLQAERILKLQHLVKDETGTEATIPWYIMTSERTRLVTQQFFEKHNYFGLKSTDIVVFEQQMLPCMSFNGKILMESPFKIARAPDGNGGLYEGLQREGVLKDMSSRGIQYLHAYCVDNILVKMADPIFLGFCLTKDVECGAKVVEKSCPTESVGVVCQVEGQFQVVEYSEINIETARKIDEDGRLTFRAGNICNHFFTLNFLKKVCGSENSAALKHHIAQKKITCIDEQGEIIHPTSPNGMKMEKFVFDVFKIAKKLGSWEVLRQDEFSPLKNSDDAGKDCPLSSRRALFDLHSRWIVNAGGEVVVNNVEKDKDTKREVDSIPFVCEISPLVSYNGEGLALKGKQFKSPLVLSSNSEIQPISIE